ncbi:hypothetical protein EIP86_006024 [Pleurotus ostreatoroseus]|nr:hypothetical protein EIP86_006024 [Pleurotus ostreatoroseus]
MVPTMMSPDTTTSGQPAENTGSSQPYYYNKPLDPGRIILDCVFAIAAMSIVVAFVFWRYLALRRARRPMRDFFRTTTYEDHRSAYQPQYVPPINPNLTIPPQSHPYERRVERAYRDPEWLPAYDDKDMPPKYVEATSTVDYLPTHPNEYTPDSPSPPSPHAPPTEH